MKTISILCGAGYNDNKYPVKSSIEYRLWYVMLQRCYSEKVHQIRPSYIGCSVSENFKSYSFFYEWCQEQVGFDKEGWHLDKDICFRGNKVYSEDTCYFVPKDLNMVLTKTNAKRGKYPIGVYYEIKSGKYKAQLSTISFRKTLGRFNTPQEAFQAYKKAKEAYIKERAEFYKDVIHPNVYNALLAYEVHEND